MRFINNLPTFLKGLTQQVRVIRDSWLDLPAMKHRSSCQCPYNWPIFSPTIWQKFGNKEFVLIWVRTENHRLQWNIWKGNQTASTPLSFPHSTHRIFSTKQGKKLPPKHEKKLLTR